MASWVNGMLGQCGGLPGGPRMEPSCGCGGCGSVETQPWPDRDGNLRAFFGCASESGVPTESPCVCGEEPEGIDDVFLALDWVPVHHFTP